VKYKNLGQKAGLEHDKISIDFPNSGWKKTLSLLRWAASMTLITEAGTT